MRPSAAPAQPSAVPDARTKAAESVLQLTRLALAAPNLPAAVNPTLEQLVRSTAAVGAAYFQTSGEVANFRVRSAWGDLPQTAGMRAIAAHGLPAETPLMWALRAAPTPLFFDDTAAQPETEGFGALGVASLAAAPVRRADGSLIGAFLMHTFVPHTWRAGEAELFGAVSGTVAALAGRLAAEEQAGEAREAALRALGLALEARDGETRGHTDRVTDLAMRLADALKLNDAERRALRWGAYLHDVGKIAISDAILLKPGKLDAGEWDLMRSHVLAGTEFAGALGFLPQAALAVIEQHHERWDGAGYPLGLAGTQIHLLARLFALCDVFDALTNRRPYKPAWTPQAALDEIRAQAGKHFDPDLVEVFARALR